MTKACPPKTQAGSNKTATAKQITAKQTTAKQTTAKETTAKQTTAKPTTAKQTTAAPLPTERTQAKNAASIAVSLTDPKFTFEAVSNVQITITCKPGNTCTAQDFEDVQKKIDALARPSTQDLPAINSAASAAEKINSLYSPKIHAFRLPGNDQIEISSFDSLDADLPNIKTLIGQSLVEEKVELPYFCLSGNLQGRPVQRARCESRLHVQASNAADIVKILAKDPNFSATAQGPNVIFLSCKTGQLCTPADRLRVLREIVARALPSPAYIQDEKVPEGSAAAIAKSIADLKFMSITAAPVGSGTVRFMSPQRVSEEDVVALLRPYLFGGQAPPAFRMFYQQPSTVVPALNPSPSAAPATTTAAPPAAASDPPPSSTTVTSTTSTVSSSTKAAPTSDTTKKVSTDDNAATPAGDTTAATGDTKPAADDKTKISDAASTPGPSTTTTSSTSTTVTPPAPKAAAAPAAPAIGKDMAAVNDFVVFTDTSNEALVRQRARLLTLLDLPRPEVLMNVWSYQASSPDGREVMRSAEQIRDQVSANNDALTNSIQYGWAYLSRQMRKDSLHQQVNNPEGPFFDHDFYDYITQKFVVGPEDMLSPDRRMEWGFCPVGKYCLGFTQAFQPVRPNLSSIILGAIASSHPLQTILTTIGCMEGKYEVYDDECFPERHAINIAIQEAKDEKMTFPDSKNRTKKGNLKESDKSEPVKGNDSQCTGCQVKNLQDDLTKKFQSLAQQQDCQECGSEMQALHDQLDGLNKLTKPSNNVAYKNDLNVQRRCIREQRRKLMKEKRYESRSSCEVLDAVALEAQETCGMAQTFPLSCFTIQATQSFASPAGFSTFTIKELNELAEEPLANRAVVRNGEDRGPSSGKPSRYGTTGVGLLRAAVADFLFNYKMSQEFPRDFVGYDLQHSAQELNAELNPLVVAFNQDVAAFSRHISEHLDSPNQTNFFQLSRSHNSFLSDALMTVRGIGGVESKVDTVTQSFFDATQAQPLSAILNNITGQGGAGGSSSSSSGSVLSALQAGTLSPGAALSALAAIVPPATQAKIGREFTLTVTPHTLPGASSAELDVDLTAGETADPALYQSGNSSALTDSTSRVARHYVHTRVRVESVNMFELSSFSALIQRPRSKIPLLPPFIELPWIGNLASVALPGAKEYHRSTAIISALIVPTAADLANGIEFSTDRLLIGATKADRGQRYEMKSVLSLSQFGDAPIRAFHKAMVSCFATNAGLDFPGGIRSNALAGGTTKSCFSLDFKRVPPEF